MHSTALIHFRTRKARLKGWTGRGKNRRGRKAPGKLGHLVPKQLSGSKAAVGIQSANAD